MYILAIIYTTYDVPIDFKSCYYILIDTRSTNDNLVVFPERLGMPIMHS